jgi:hypothetical protein
MACFHAHVTTYDGGNGFLLDLDEVAVVQDLLLPIYNKDNFGTRQKINHRCFCVKG